MGRAPGAEVHFRDRILEANCSQLLQSVFREPCEEKNDLRAERAVNRAEVGLCVVRDEDARRQVQGVAEHFTEAPSRLRAQGVRRAGEIRAPVNDELFLGLSMRGRHAFIMSAPSRPINRFPPLP